MLITLLRPHVHSGTRHEAGATIDVDKATFDQLVEYYNRIREEQWQRLEKERLLIDTVEGRV